MGETTKTPRCVLLELSGEALASRENAVAGSLATSLDALLPEGGL